MQLAPGERSILSYFPTDSKAEEAIKALKSAGIGEAQLNRISRYGVTHDAHYDNPINRAETLTGLTLFSKGMENSLDTDTRVLQGADPSVSGYGDAGYGLAGGRAFMVTVVTNEAKLDQAVDILKQHGGKV